MRRRAIVVVMLMAFGLPGAASAGGPAGFFFRGSFSGSDAAVAGGVFGAVALGFAGAGEAYRGTGWREDPAMLIIDATPPDALVYLDGRSLARASPGASAPEPGTSSPTAPSPSASGSI